MRSNSKNASIAAAALLVAAAAGAVLLAGCSSKPEESASAPPAQQAAGGAPPAPPMSPDMAKLTPNSAGGSNAAADPHAGMDMSAMGNPHAGAAMGGVPNPHNMEQGGKEDPRVTTAVSDAAAQEGALKANPNDPDLKKKAAQADLQAGLKMMTESNMRPEVKYPGALKYFRRVLQLDPSNKEAASYVKMMEDIYRSMNRPIPQ